MQFVPSVDRGLPIELRAVIRAGGLEPPTVRFEVTPSFASLSSGRRRSRTSAARRRRTAFETGRVPDAFTFQNGEWRSKAPLTVVVHQLAVPVGDVAEPAPPRWRHPVLPAQGDPS